MSKKCEKIIILPVEEALGIALAMNPTPDDAHIKEWLIERINQTEIKHLKREIAQWKEEQARDDYYQQLFLKNVENQE